MACYFPNSLGFFLTGAVLLTTGGCHAPLFGRGDFAAPAAAVHRTPPTGNAAADPQTVADEATVAAVMQDVREIGAEDPAAQRLLLDELGRSPTHMWPLVVRQFHSTRAYHQELVAREGGRGKGESGEDFETIQSSPSPLPLPPSPLSDVRPSELVGRLTDPRGVQPDPALERAFAKATPANMPPPGGEVGGQGGEARGQRSEVRGDGILHSSIARAAFERGGDSSTGVEPALFTMAANESSASRITARTASDADDRSSDWRRHLELAVDDLRSRTADAPQSTAEMHQLVSLRLLELVAGDTEAALAPIANISAAEQDYWSDQVFALATLLDHHSQPDDKRRAAASVAHLDEAVGHLRELGSLSLRNLAFCRQVYDYGAYEPYDEAKFAPGQQTTLYVEVENYHSESTEKGYTTSLGTSYELVDDAGKRFEGGEFPNVDDCCRGRRRDFHIQYGLVLPKTLPAGAYRLKLIMKDRQSDKIGHAQIAFDVR